METLNSLEPSFRYLWSMNKETPTYSDFIAGQRVLVGYVDPTEVRERAIATRDRIVERTPRLRTQFGALELTELNGRATNEYFEQYKPVLQELLGPRAIRFAQPELGVINHSVQYHVDMPFSGSIFGAWCIDGPERIVRFSQMGLEVPFKPGTLLLFDPAQPHAMLSPGALEFSEEQPTDGSLVTMASFMVTKTPKVCEVMGVERFGVKKHKNLRKTQPQYRACPRTGQLTFQS